MRMTYWYAGKNYERALAGCLVEGAAAAGIELTVRPTADYGGPEADGSLILGVVKREILWDHQQKRHPIVIIDKGYCRDRIALDGSSVPAWWRMCWQALHPTAYLMALDKPPDRWRAMGRQLMPRRYAPHGNIVILGSSAKFHQTMRIEDPTTWATDVVAGIRRHATNPIIYRPKPSWKYATPVPGAGFDWGQKTPVTAALTNAHCTVTYGSIACVDSIVAGVPCIILGNAVAMPICDTWINDIADPYWPEQHEREQWAANLAYCNFTPAEIGDGTAWKTLKEQMPYAL